MKNISENYIGVYLEGDKMKLMKRAMKNANVKNRTKFINDMVANYCSDKTYEAEQDFINAVKDCAKTDIFAERLLTIIREKTLWQISRPDFFDMACSLNMSNKDRRWLAIWQKFIEDNCPFAFQYPPEIKLPADFKLPVKYGNVVIYK